jgi:hypothetical protein
MSAAAWGNAFVLTLAFVCLLIGTATDSWSTYKDSSDDIILGKTEVEVRESFFWLCSKYDQELSDIHTDECYHYQLCKAFNEKNEREDTYDIKNSQDDDPNPRDQYCDKTRAGQAFSIMAVIFSFFAACSSIAWAFRKHNHSASGATALAIIATICALISFAIWGDWNENNSNFEDFGYGYSFILFTIGWILLLVGAVMSWSLKTGYSS